VPNTESSLLSPCLHTTTAISLLQKIGPPVLMGHSFGTQYAVGAGFTHPELVKGVINLEGMAGHVCNLTPTELSGVSRELQDGAAADRICRPHRWIHIPASISAVHRSLPPRRWG
jgi:hypothetical protein